MYKKSKKKRNRIRRMKFFEIQVLPYIFTALILFIIFIGIVAWGIEFSNEYTMTAWIIIVGYTLGSIILDFMQGNIKIIIKKTDIFISFLEKKMKKLFFICMVTIYLSTRPVRAYMKQVIVPLKKNIASTFLKVRKRKNQQNKWYWFTIRRSVSFLIETQ